MDSVLCSHTYARAQTNNFIRVLRTLPDASALGLLIDRPDSTFTQLAGVVQSFARFIVNQLKKVLYSLTHVHIECDRRT
jgi:hypothetical protein